MALSPEWTEARVSLGTALLKAKQLNEAVVVLRGEPTSLQSDPRVLALLGFAYHDLADHIHAAQSFELAIS